MPIEIEKKYRLTGRQRSQLPRKLEAIGATHQSEEFEENPLYSGKRIDAGSAALRLRRVGDRAILTYKKRFPSRSAIKRQHEEETEVADAEALDSILRALGYKVALVYEKRRLTWTIDETEIVIDELPFGHFMEIEGLEADIAKVEHKLGAAGFEAEFETYPSLTRVHGKATGDVVEARFAKSSRSSGRSNRRGSANEKTG